MDSKTIETYNQLAREYDEETSDFWELFPRAFIDTFATEVGNGKILNVGSGPGRDGLLLKDRRLDVTCLDASSAMVELSRQRGLTSIVGDFLDLPFENESFEGVWAYTSLLHIPKSDIRLAFTEIRRVLKLNGVFALGLIEGSTESYRESSGVNQPRWFSYYSHTEVMELLQEFNFKFLHSKSFKPKSKNYLHFLSRKA
jgi:ubiquinone/menaquinone biosynthesis C-methylase UbiE